MPIYFIQVVRRFDQLVLTSTMDDGAQVSKLKLEAKSFYSQMGDIQKSPRMSFRISDGVIYVRADSAFFSVCVADTAAAPITVFELLEKVNAEFANEYGEAVQAAEKEYVFMDFHTTLDGLRAQYMRASANASMGRLQNELENVQTAMADNIKKALVRDEMLKEVGDVSEELVKGSKMFATESTNLNRYYIWNTYGRTATVIGIVGLIYFLVSFII